MEGSDSLRHRKRKAAFAWLCCCCSDSRIVLEPDSQLVRITAGIIAIIAMLISGVGFSALQRATHNPYEHLFTTGSSPKQYTTPSAWGPASAPAPSPFLQPMLQASGGTLSIESSNEGTPEPAPSRQQSGLTSESASFGPASSQSSRASSPGLAHPYGAPGSAPFTPAASTAGGASASIESASPEDNGAAPPGAGQAELSPIIPYSNSSKGVAVTNAVTCCVACRN